jgi:hypothetical protein
MLKKHKVNIFPELTGEAYDGLKNDIIEFGYDDSMPVILFEGDVLDGWNRAKVCFELDFKPPTKNFEGSLIEARDFCWRTNKRRDLTSQQWSTLAVEDEELVKAIQEETERQRREKQAETQKVTQTKEHGELCNNLLLHSPTDRNENTVVTKLAKQSTNFTKKYHESASVKTRGYW